MNLDQTYDRLLKEVESDKRQLFYNNRNYVDYMSRLTEDERKEFERERKKKEDAYFKKSEICLKFEDSKRCYEEYVKSKEEEIKTTIPKHRKKGRKPLIHYRINRINYETRDKIELLRTLIQILGGEKFLEIVDDDTFKYKSFFKDRNKEPHKKPNLKEINRQVHLSSEFIFKSIEEILPKTDLTMSISVNGKNVLDYRHS